MSVIASVNKKCGVIGLKLKHDVTAEEAYPCTGCIRRVGSFKPCMPKMPKKGASVDVCMCFGCAEPGGNVKVTDFYSFSYVKAAVHSIKRNLKHTVVWNTVLCSDVGIDLKELKPPLEVVSHCSDYVKHDISVQEPYAILVFGLEALQAFGQGKVKGMTIAKAKATPFEFKNIPVIVTYHPDFIAKSGGTSSKHWDVWVSDIERAYDHASIPF